MGSVTPSHWFRPSSTTRVPKNWLFWYALPRFTCTDSCTRTAKLACVAGSVCVRRDGGWRVVESINTLDPEKFNKFVLDHSGPKFSLQCVTYWLTLGAQLIGLFDRMANREWGIHDTRRGGVCRTDATKTPRPSHGMVVDSDPPTILSLWHSSGVQAKWLDLRNWIPRSLPEIAVCVGRDWRTWDSTETDLCSLRITCEEAVSIVRDAAQRLIDEWCRLGMGQWRPSIGGLASSSYRVSCPTRSILIDKDPLATKICREAYYGGEVKLFRPGRHDGPIYEIDVNAAYGWAMASQMQPVAHCTNMREPSVAQLESSMRLWWHAAVVRVESDSLLLPVRRKGFVRYPTGSFWTTLCGPELDDAMRAGVIKEVYCAAVYRNGRPFSEWVSQRWEHRKLCRESGDKLTAGFHKNLAVSLYGRWAMKTSPWNDLIGENARLPFMRWTHVDMPTGKVTERRSVGWCVQEKADPEEHSDSLPAIAANVTSHVRKLMRHLRSVAGRQNVLWQCVDCLHVNQEGRDRLDRGSWLDSDRLGMMSVKNVYDWVEYLSQHDARFPGGHKTVGLQRDATPSVGNSWVQWCGPGMAELLTGEGREEYRQWLTEWSPRYINYLEQIGPDGILLDQRYMSDEFPESLRFDIWGDGINATY